MPLSKSSSKILILGAGTFGVSTALHLLRRGYKNITLLDAYPVPSPIAAGNDTNKILITASSDPFLSRLSRQAYKAWHSDPIFSPYLHETGIVICGNSPEVIEEIDARANDWRARGYSPRKVTGGKEFAEVIPALTGEMEGWIGYHLAPENGWLAARNALVSAAEECRRLGATFVQAKVTALVYDDETGDVVGAKSEDGREFRAEKTVLSMGASSVEVFDFRKQLMAKCWTLAHIKVTGEEAKGLKDHPLLLNFEKGFFFEPDEYGEVKICNEFPGYTHIRESDGLSVPFRKEQIPLEAEKGVRKLLEETIPEWKDREFVWARICWCVDTPDRRFILCEYPEKKGLVLATGDSGLAFKFLPTVGGWIADVVEYGDAGLPEEERHNWRWRPETGGDWDDTGDRWGGDGKVKDIKEIDGWTDIPSRN